MQRVLVVEDDPVLALHLQQVLSVEGFDVIGPIPDVDTAMEIASGQGFELAVLDVNVGGQSSHRVARALTGRRIPFIFVTGYDRATIEPEFSAHIVLTKPVDAGQVSAALRQIMKT